MKNVTVKIPALRFAAHIAALGLAIAVMTGCMKTDDEPEPEYGEAVEFTTTIPSRQSIRTKGGGESTGATDAAAPGAVAPTKGEAGQTPKSTEANQSGESRAAAQSAPQTRTTDGGNSWLIDDQVGIFMHKTGETFGSLGANIAYKPSAGGTASTNLTPVSSTNALWWPQSGTADFAAYYPHKTLAQGSTEFPVSVADQSSPGAIDVLYASATGKSKGSNVGLTFGHKMTKLHINTTAGKGIGADELDGMTITVSGMPTTAALDLTDGSLSGKDNVADLVSGAIALDGGLVPSYEVIVIPQSADEFTGRRITFTLASGEIHDYALPDSHIFREGKAVKYDLTVNAEGVVLSAFSITDWNIHDNGTQSGNLRGIWTEDDLRQFSADWNATYDDSYSAEQIAANKEAVISRWSDDGTATGTIRVRADIAMTPANGNFTPISQGNSSYGGNDHFNAKFDGGGFTITGLTVNVTSRSYAGLFGYIAAEGEVSNVKLTGAEVSASSSSSNSGGIAGRNYGSITGCSVEAKTISGSSSGGIAGYNYGSITGCSVDAEAITATGSGFGNYSGGITGNNYGAITECSVVAEAISAIGGSYSRSGGIAGENGDSGSIAGCTVDAKTISGPDSGGIAGYNSGSIAGCSVVVTQTISGLYTSGAIAGLNRGSIAGCTVDAKTISATGSTMNYSGGIAGDNSGSIAGCSVVAETISATGGSLGNYSGGIAGITFSGNSIAGCHWLNEGSQPGNAVGQNQGGTASNCYTFTSAADFGVEMVNLMNNAIYDYNAGAVADKLCDFRWKAGTVGINDGYPTLVKDAPAAKTNGIYSEWGLRQFAADWNATFDALSTASQVEANKNAVIANWSDDGTATGTIRLRADITMDPANGNFTPIGQGNLGGYGGDDYFNAKFDGGGFTISGLTINVTTTEYDAYAGLFGYIAAEGEISNVKLADATISASGSSNYSGGIVGVNNGSIAGCAVVAQNITATGGARDNCSGGIAGVNCGSIAGCAVDAQNISANSSNGKESSSGGIAGRNESSIAGCTVVAQTISASGSSGSDSSSGGIAGKNGNSCSIAGCAVVAQNITATGAGDNCSGGIAGYNGNSCSIAGCAVYAEAISAAGGNNYSGGIVGYDGYSSSIAGSHWLKDGQQPGNAAGGGSASASNCYSFTSAADFRKDDYNYIGQGVTLLSLMNDAITNYNSMASADKKCYFIWQDNPSGYPTLAPNP